MKIWTSQRNSTLEIIIKNGVYLPKLELADGMGSDGMKAIYPDLLDTYRSLNIVDCDGLAFAISSLDEKKVSSFHDYKAFFYSEPTFSSSVSFFGEDYTILELEIEEKLDLLPINFQDFIIIAMRKSGKDWRRYTKNSLLDVPYNSFKNDLKIAQKIGFTIDENNNKIEQCHVHYIDIKDIIGVYPVIDFDSSTTYKLSKEANQLLKIIK